MYESDVKDWFEELDSSLEGIRRSAGVDVFPLDDRKLDLSIDLSFDLDLHPFDHCVLAAVLGRAEELRLRDADGELAFCVRDPDLWPWHKKTGATKKELRDLYDRRCVWGYGDFEMLSPNRPAGWPLS